MKLLVTTQAVDLDDPVLGFFHRWLEEFSKHFDSIEVICLREGRHSLPENVRVHSLGRERSFELPAFAEAPACAEASAGRSAGRRASSFENIRRRIRYVRNFYRYAWGLRREYDAVFVHMNPEYVVLGGVLWKLLGTRTVLWRNHKKGSFLTRIAAILADTVCYTSPEAYVARFHNSQKMPIGIDTQLFSPGSEPRKDSLLFLGRLDAVKRPDVFLEAVGMLLREGKRVTADFYGEPTPGREAYAAELKRRFVSLHGVTYHGNIPNADTPPLYRSHQVYVNLTPSGSFDKTIGEAMACGALVVCSNDAVREVVPAALMAGTSVRSTSDAIRHALELPAGERAELAAANRAYIQREHSLALLADRLRRSFEVHNSSPGIV